MKSWLWGMLLVTGVATAACGASPSPARAPAPSSTTETVVTIEPTPVVTVTVPPTSSVTAPAATKTSVRKTPTRQPPRFGYQCRDGDERKYDVCAGHRAWVDGQREFTGCLDSGGNWDIENQRCERP
ncbi:hypothetical protein QRX60_35140 [Amycolatopsis mongoliensis]|uniref:Chitin-binding type-2 domain-containing protein n=1 Tax=Amycolatopsis mongoliensis TaxID=715475 RepID=A0A9Y2JIJ6_9PSEU|nr:hypothetical protein [Amycolatopsis sp. 4-36]WIX99260.1 hypothetical protein QRX60_35140 [Amycolatopsis sp. 4-36]